MSKVVYAAAAVAVLCACPCIGLAIDRDDDGLDDAVEQLLLDRHRPELVYVGTERHWPHSAIDHISRSQLVYPDVPGVGDVVAYSATQLQADPRLVLRGKDAYTSAESSSIAVLDARSKWALSQWDMRNAGVYPGIDGSNHRGMYGHVFKTRDGRILIQYWQLFPFSEAETVSDCGDHEGDWVWLDVYVEDQALLDYPLRSIVYHHHGSGCTPTALPWPEGHPWHPAPISLPQDGMPVCYLEEQTHEWWPWASEGAECDFDPIFDLGPNATHRGDGLRYRVPSVLNVGEKYFPMPGVEAEVVVMYNGNWGRWGAECGGHDFDPPEGPTPRSAFYLSFGRPPTANARRYVDPSASGVANSAPLGSPYAPYNSLAAAAQGLVSGGSIAVRPGPYAAPLTISQPTVIEAWR